MNARYFGSYETHLASGGKIIIDSNGCKLEKMNLMRREDVILLYMVLATGKTYKICVPEMSL